MKPVFLLALLLTGSGCSTASPDQPRPGEDPMEFDERRWFALDARFKSELESLGEHPWAGDYLSWISHLYLAPRSGWFYDDGTCEAPFHFYAGSIQETQTGLVFLDERGTRLTDDTFETVIILPLESMIKVVKWEIDWMDESESDRRALATRYVSRVESVLRRAQNGRKK